MLATAGTVCYCTDVLDNPWCSSLRVVRFGRAACAVSGAPFYCEDVYYVCSAVFYSECGLQVELERIEVRHQGV